MRPNDCPPDPRLTSCGKLWCTFANNNAVGNDNVIVEEKKKILLLFHNQDKELKKTIEVS